jgi:hypothetical protein
MLARQLSFLACATAAGVVVGVRVPMILTSRTDAARMRVASCAVAMLMARACRAGALVRGTSSLDQMRGKLSRQKQGNDAAFEWTSYPEVLRGYGLHVKRRRVP